MKTNEIEVEVNGNKVTITLTDEQIKQLQAPKKKEWYRDRSSCENPFIINNDTNGRLSVISGYPTLNFNLSSNVCAFNNRPQAIIAADYINLFIEMYNFCQLRNGGNKVDWSDGEQTKWGVKYDTAFNGVNYTPFSTTFNPFVFGLAVLSKEHIEEMLSIFGDRIKEVYSKLQNY